MGWWSDESQWVSEDGVRCYFTERARGGPTRLECYRRILTQPANPPPGRARLDLAAYLDGIWRLAGRFELMKSAAGEARGH